jgi:hypothetical protein
MKKTFSAFALIAAVAAGTIGLTVGSASAHAQITYDCSTVTVNFDNFSQRVDGEVNTGQITVNGEVTNVQFAGPSFVAQIPFVSHSGDADVVVHVTWVGTQPNPATDFADATFPTDDCSPPPTTTTAPPTTTTTVAPQVSPAVAVRPAAAVIASPTFTG